jgi:hypothetical protein
MKSLIDYSSVETSRFEESITIQVNEENKFNNRIYFEIENYTQLKMGISICITDCNKRVVAYRHLSISYVIGSEGKCTAFFNELFCLYPDLKYTLSFISDDVMKIICKNAIISADLSYERIRSHLIGNRKYYDTLKKRIEATTCTDDILSVNEINNADNLAIKGNYIQAIKSLFKTDVLILPIMYSVSYQLGREIQIEPFNIFLKANCDVIIYLEVKKYNDSFIELSLKADDNCMVEMFSSVSKNKKNLDITAKIIYNIRMDI